MIGAPCQSSSSLTRTRTVSSRQIRQRGSLRSKSAVRGSAALVIVLIRRSSIRATATSDTDMAFLPRSRERARWLVVSFSQKRDLLRDKEETSSAGQRQVTSTPKWAPILVFL